jgi:hypothetical protein
MAKMLLGIAKTDTLEMLCLANSRKMQGRCVAGLRTDGQGWIRPVSAGADGTLHLADYRLPDGTEPRLLDTIAIGVRGPKPEPHQPENHQISRTSWRLLARPGPNEVPDTVQDLLHTSVVKGPLLLGSFGDKCDYGPLKRQPAAASLALIVPDALAWVIQSGYRGNRQTKAEFRLTRTPYCLSVTDPVWAQRLAHLPNGRYPKEAAGLRADDKVLFTISLSEPLAWNNHCYKLVAGVIVLPE